MKIQAILTDNIVTKHQRFHVYVSRGPLSLSWAIWKPSIFTIDGSVHAGQVTVIV